MPILFRYIRKEILTPLVVSLLAFCGILFLARSLKLIELIVNKNVPIWDILTIFALLLPKFIEIALPMSLILGIIIGLGRLSIDSELLVIRGIGLNLKRISFPILQVAVFCTLITLALTLWLRPLSSYRLGLALFDLAKSQASATINAGVFNELGPLTIYAEQVQKQGTELENVVIGDNSNPQSRRTFVAKHGKIISDKKNRSLILKLFDGSIPEGHGKNFTVTTFETNQINIPLYSLSDFDSERGGKKSTEMYLSELKENINKQENNSHYLVELHQRFAVPTSCLLLAITAMMLGIQPSRGGNTWSGTLSLGFGISLILIYYLLFAFLSALADNQSIPAGVGVWTPNLLLLLLSIYLFKKLNSEQWISVGDAFFDTVERIRGQKY